MALPLYLAMTAGEIRENSQLPAILGYMACHFSPYGTGLSNLPKSLPPDSLLILNDRTPIHGHDPHRICCQLEDAIKMFRCTGVLLDFQRPDCEETAALVSYLSRQLPHPFAVSHSYAAMHSGAVLLPPPPLDISISEYVFPWKGREIWLEAALDSLLLTVTKDGCSTSPLPVTPLSAGFPSEVLHCHYTVKISRDAAEFTLQRSREDLEGLLEEAATLGVTAAVGLWQELR